MGCAPEGQAGQVGYPKWESVLSSHLTKNAVYKNVCACGHVRWFPTHTEWLTSNSYSQSHDDCSVRELIGVDER